MKTALFLAISIAIAASAHSQAATKALATKPDATCATSPSDPHEGAARIQDKSKSYAGQCVDTQRFRDLKLIKDDNRSIVFANYLHEGKFWTATIDKSAEIDALFFHVVRFEVISGVTAAHTQFRVRFKNKNAVRLSLNTDPSQTATTNDIVMSYEAARPADVPYNFALGVVDNYILVARGMSGQQRQAESETENTEQYELKFKDPADAKKMLLASIRESNTLGMKNYYNTLHPNCTTSVFDLIDKETSEKTDGNEPFLTVLSNDPIAGPSLEGLEDREILKGGSIATARYANLKDELETGATNPPRDEKKKASLQFLPHLEGYPYSLVFFSPNSGRRAELDRKAKRIAYELAPKIVQSLGSAIMLGGSDSSNTLFAALKPVGDQMKAELQKINNSLTDEPITVSLYLTPFDENKESIDVLQTLGVKARLPFETYNLGANDNIFTEVTANLHKASAAQSLEEKTIGAVGMVAHIQLAKDRSKITLQVLANLGAKMHDLVVEHEQVTVKKLQISDAENQPVVLMNFSQALKEERPRMILDFGPFGGITGSISPERHGLFQVFKGAKNCELQAASSPQLLGNLKILNKPVQFKILGLELDLEKQNVKEMDVRVGTAPFKCIESKTVEEQFKDNANSRIENWKDENLNGMSIGLSILQKILAR